MNSDLLNLKENKNHGDFNILLSTYKGEITDLLLIDNNYFISSFNDNTIIVVDISRIKHIIQRIME